MSAGRYRWILQWVGALVLLLGIGTAIRLVGLRPPPVPPDQPNGEWQDSSLAITDSKSATRNIELYGGKMEVVLVQLLEWFQRPETLALFIVSGAVLIAVGCFGIARQLPPRSGKIL